MFVPLITDGVDGILDIETIVEAVATGENIILSTSWLSEANLPWIHGPKLEEEVYVLSTAVPFKTPSKYNLNVSSNSRITLIVCQLVFNCVTPEMDEEITVVVADPPLRLVKRS